MSSDVVTTPALLGWVRPLVAAAFVVALPLLVISASLRWLVTDRDLLLDGFRQGRVDQVTGLDQAQLERVADAFVAYFQAPPGRMDVVVRLGGETRPLFNEREIAHMEDVQALVQLFLRLLPIAALLVALRVAYAAGVERGWRPLGHEMLWSAGLVVALVAGIGLFALVDFPLLWTTFHRVAFRNDLWLLDPRTDYLIMLFPQPTWFAYTLRMALATAGGMALVALIGAWLARPGGHTGSGV